MSAADSFAAFFRALWGLDPFPWQEMLVDYISAAGWPAALDLPPASGKTACVDVAVFTLAAQARRPLGERTAPRRVWFVVDRRIVVDEVYERARLIANRLADATSGPLRDVADALRALAGTARPLAAGRLRGGVLLDDGSARIPSQPAVITSTVDQLGSRLLFRAYGSNQRTAPILAGLAANDSLILLDEAHCAVPFLETVGTIERLRGRPWAEAPLKTPFAFVVMSATPPDRLPKTAIFPGVAREQALAAPELQRRLSVSKEAELVVVPSRRGSADSDAFVEEAARRAQAFVLEGKLRVAVMVNRVATAVRLAEVLRGRAEDEFEVALLTGRLRPLERDLLVDHWKAFLRAREPEPLSKAVVVVTTQCLEVGADFSFEGLVTEAASLDALRQRFGRLDRLGDAGASAATILIREEDTDPAKAKPDPVYGSAIAHTWQLLKGLAKEGTRADLGTKAVQAKLRHVDDLTRYLAPVSGAPVLLPPHLDLLCQTAPLPHPEPDVQLYLHGIGRAAYDVQVLWRADLGEDEGTWVDTLGLCRPVTGEQLTVPLWQVRAWLQGEIAPEGGADVEGAGAGEAGEGLSVKQGSGSRPCLVWRGRERSRVTRDPDALSPGDIVVIPAHFGLSHLGQPSTVEGTGKGGLDLWERALPHAGRPAAVRLNRMVLAPWLDCQEVRSLVELAEAPDVDAAEVSNAIDAVLAYEPSSADDPTGPPRWWRDLLSEARGGRMYRHPGGGLVLFARAGREPAEEPDLFSDDDDLTSLGVEPQTLNDHADLVRRCVRKIAERCLPEDLHEAVVEAAYWHDCGKLDERFQTLLHDGHEALAAATPEPRAKSTWIPASPTERRLLREASGLPENFRHEMLSLQLAETHASSHVAPDVFDLFLHLVASHHGYARPLAPVCVDPDPPPVSGQLGSVSLQLSAAARRAWRAHRYDSGIAERFWALTRRYGWWGLAYLEAIVRLGDWYASGLRVRPPTDAGKTSAGRPE